ncbi:MAG: hypothetical protein JO123_05640 [Ktedonobacteraceae bacterium]|nr:hypothetical protein [Ktedonobacteraceae bacterium]
MNRSRRLIFILGGVFVALLVAVGIGRAVYLSRSAAGSACSQPNTQTASLQTLKAAHHYEYVVPDGSMYVYDVDHGYQLVKHVNLPTKGVRGVVASPATCMLYISYGGNGTSHGTGSLLAYNLLTDAVLWSKNYPFGIDSMSIAPDGKTIYMPDGSLSYDGNVYVLAASDGHVTKTINTRPGASTHNTIVSSNGAHIYIGATDNKYLYQADAATNQIIKRIGPMLAGVRPFTINGKETLAFTNATDFIGFQVSSITTGKVLYTVPVKGFKTPKEALSHGISLSPDEKEIYLIDAPNSYAHVFDVSGLPATAPKQVADIRLTPMTGLEAPCAYDCGKEGWIEHSRDGRFVYVGDSGDVIDTTSRTIIAHLPALSNSRKYLEIDWANGMPIFTTNRHGIGYVTT